MENQNQQVYTEQPVQPAPQLVQQSFEAKKSFPKWLTVGIGLIVLILIISGAYFLGQKSTVKITEKSSTSTPLSSPKPTAQTANPTTNWKTATISVEKNNAMLGKYTLNTTLKIPSDWKLTTSQNNGCTNSVISNNKGFSMNLDEICSGWADTHPSWPTNSVIALKQKMRYQGGSGQAYDYRIRYKDNAGYKYVDAYVDATKELNETEDKTWGVLGIFFTPPNEETHDSYFIVANLTTTNGNESDLAIADKIAASIWLDSLIQKQ